MKRNYTMAEHAIETVRAGSPIKALLLSLRPYQWVKNVLVFSGLVFSGSLLDWHAITISLNAFALFCLASSGIYLLNDLRDLEQDRRHPIKRIRPLASGAVGPATAAVLMVVLLTSALLGALMVNVAFAIVLTGYVLLNLVYSFGLKRIEIVCVMFVAMGFVLRAVAGAVAIGVKPSPWLLLCTLMLALLVTFGKRRHELDLLGNAAHDHRSVLHAYSPQFLDMAMGISGATAVLTYSLYTVAPETAARVGSPNLVLTTPFVLYGVFRYLYLILLKKEGGDPAALFVKDRPTLVNVLLWVLSVSTILYWYRW